MFWHFGSDDRGNLSAIAAIALVPIMASLALAVDGAQLSRQKQVATNALDSASAAAIRRLADGAETEQAAAYAKQVFIANLDDNETDNASLSVTFAEDVEGILVVNLSTTLKYKSIFLPGELSIPVVVDASTKQFDRRDAKVPISRDVRPSGATAQVLFGKPERR